MRDRSKYRLTDVNITESSQALSEGLDGLWVSLDLLSVWALGASLLLGVEAQVLEQENLSVRTSVDSILSGLSDRVLEELHVSSVQQL